MVRSVQPPLFLHSQDHAAFNKCGLNMCTSFFFPINQFRCLLNRTCWSMMIRCTTNDNHKLFKLTFLWHNCGNKKKEKKKICLGCEYAEAMTLFIAKCTEDVIEVKTFTGLCAQGLCWALDPFKAVRSALCCLFTTHDCCCTQTWREPDRQTCSRYHVRGNNDCSCGEEVRLMMQGQQYSAWYGQNNRNYHRFLQIKAWAQTLSISSCELKRGRIIRFVKVQIPDCLT